MITDPSKTIINKEQEITIFDDSHEISEKLREIARESELSASENYYLKEAATHIEALFDNYKSLLFIHYKQTEENTTSNTDPRKTVYLKDLDLPNRIISCIKANISKRYSEITLLDIETAEKPESEAWPEYDRSVMWDTMPGIGKNSVKKLKSIMDEHGYHLHLRNNVGW